MALFSIFIIVVDPLILACPIVVIVVIVVHCGSFNESNVSNISGCIFTTISHNHSDHELLRSRANYLTRILVCYAVSPIFHMNLKCRLLAFYIGAHAVICCSKYLFYHRSLISYQMCQLSIQLGFVVTMVYSVHIMCACILFMPAVIVQGWQTSQNGSNSYK
jgi:hypothetical protein